MCDIVPNWFSTNEYIAIWLAGGAALTSEKRIRVAYPFGF